MNLRMTLKTSRVHLFLALVIAVLATATKALAADGVEARVDKALAQLSLDQKIQLLAGVDGMYTYAMPSIGLPRLKMSDGPVGTKNDGPSTAYPAGVLLAATWDPAIAQREGVALGQNGRARGDNFILGPAVNICRQPQDGRNFEYFGEDPYLAGRMAVGYIMGVQSQGVAACIKHFTANNQETHRGDINEIISQRALHEIYLPAFEAAVRQAHVRSIMAAYNKINGLWMTANKPLLTNVLKNDWGFDGIAMSDWGATHDTKGPANAGLDLEMPSGIYFNAKDLKPLIESGAVTKATIDDKVRRILRVAYEMKWDQRPQKEPSIPLDNPATRAVALDVAREGLVLLKNQNHLLPLDAGKIHSLVLVGPNADQYVSGGGSSIVTPQHPVTILDGIQALVGPSVKITRIDFPSLDKSWMNRFAQHSTYESSLHAEYFNNPTLSGKPVLEKNEAYINHDWQDHLPNKQVTNESFSVRWTGKIKAAKTGPVTFAARSDDGIRIKLDGKTILQDWTDHAALLISTVHNLVAGQTHHVVVEYYNAGGDAVAQFGWAAKPTEGVTEAERKTIANADAVLACVGTEESEGADRRYDLPAPQQQLLDQVTKINPHTVVILNAGGDVNMQPWISKAGALLDAWYPGEAGGTAIAETLFGKINPSGHLPDTFGKSWSDYPSYGHYPGIHGTVIYAEGIYVGYRWFDHKDIQPMFCFGDGLSYTTFKMSNLKITPAKNGNQNSFEVSATVKNAGDRAGAAVAQFYVRPPSDVHDQPMQQLKGFKRVMLQPGQSATVTVPLNQRSFAYWDTDARRWAVRPGEYTVAMGASSRDVRATATVNCK